MGHLPCVQNVLFHLVLTTTLGSVSTFILPVMERQLKRQMFAQGCIASTRQPGLLGTNWLRAGFNHCAISSCLVDAL